AVRGRRGGRRRAAARRARRRGRGEGEGEGAREPHQLGGGGASRLGRRGRGAAGSGARGRGSGSPRSSLIATDAAAMPNTDGTTSTEPSTRCRCSQSLTPLWPPGQTHWNAPSSYASARGAIGGSSE